MFVGLLPSSSIQTHVNNIQQTKDTAVYNATIIPYESNLNEPITNPKESICSCDATTREVKYSGNDDFYLNHCGEVKEGEGEGGVTSDYPQFQIRVNISKASEGLAAKKFYDKLFYKRKELAMKKQGGAALSDKEEEELDVDAWVAQDEELAQLQQDLIDAQQQHNGNGSSGGGGALGYYVEMMLLEPHIKPEDIVISPPIDLDKSAPNSRPTTVQGTRADEEAAKASSGGGLFQKDMFTSRQFTSAGPWERTNIKAFGDMVLDVRKALVRVEFPVFPEGGKEKTFKETYQLNARVSFFSKLL